MVYHALLGLALLGLVTAVPSPASKRDYGSLEVAHIRSFFFVGQNYVDNGKGEHVFTNQLYVERLQPAGGITKAAPVLLMHGNGQTGTVSARFHFDTYAANATWYRIGSISQTAEKAGPLSS